MIRWKLWDIAKDGEPPQYAMHTHGNGWMVLQQLAMVYRPESKNYFGGEYQEWQDIPLHIESKK